MDGRKRQIQEFQDTVSARPAIIRAKAAPSKLPDTMTAETDMRDTTYARLKVRLRRDDPPGFTHTSDVRDPEPDTSRSGSFFTPCTVAEHAQVDEVRVSRNTRFTCANGRKTMPRGHVKDKPFEIHQGYIDELELSGPRLLVYALIASSGSRPLGQREIARRCALSTRSVARALHELEEAGLIACERRGAGPGSPAIWRALRGGDAADEKG